METKENPLFGETVRAIKNSIKSLLGNTYMNKLYSRSTEENFMNEENSC